MPSEPIDNQILGALVTLLQGIVAGATYLTSPFVTEGIPPDQIPSVDLQPRIYVAHVRTDLGTPALSGPSHQWSARFAVYIAAKTAREASRVRSDVLRAVYAGEASLQASFQQPAYPLEFSRLDELKPTGIEVAVQMLGLDYQTDHTAT